MTQSIPRSTRQLNLYQNKEIIDFTYQPVTANPKVSYVYAVYYMSQYKKKRRHGWAAGKEKPMDSRRKGADGERELSRILRSYGYSCRRGQQYCGSNGDADVVGIPGIHIECKRVESLNIDKAMEQSVKDARSGEIPAVFHRKNGKKWKVTLNLDDFMSLYNGANCSR